MQLAKIGIGMKNEIGKESVIQFDFILTSKQNVIEKYNTLNRKPVQFIRPVLLIETVRLAVRTFGKPKTSTLNRKPVQLIRPVLLIEQYL